MERKFGIEIELFGIPRASALRALGEVGINIVDEGYNHATRNHWKIVSDGSVSDGFEVVSPVLEGEHGLEQVRTVITALDDLGGRVDRRCGLHVHFDAANLNVDHMRTIVSRYAAHEGEIDAFMPASRRGNSNSYCRSLAGLIARPEFRSAANPTALVGATRGSRYFKINLQSYQRHGTIEFRQHSGTLNAPKACNWVRLLDAFITESVRKANGQTAPTATHSVPVQAFANLRGVRAELAGMFQQGSVSLQAMCERFGWQPHSARAAVTRLRRAGMDIECPQGTNVYHLCSQAGIPSCQPAPADDSLWDGIAEPLRIFYLNRTVALRHAA